MTAPRLPGVYLFRDPNTHAIVYVGEAGERAGSGHARGLWGRLGVYRIGKGGTSGFGEAALDRALADVDFLTRQLDRVRAGETMRAKAWAQDAIAWWNPEVCWAICPGKTAAKELEALVEAALDGGALLNRRRGRAPAHRR